MVNASGLNIFPSKPSQREERQEDDDDDEDAEDDGPADFLRRVKHGFDFAARARVSRRRPVSRSDGDECFPPSPPRHRPSCRCRWPARLATSGSRSSPYHFIMMKAKSAASGSTSVTMSALRTSAKQHDEDDEDEDRAFVRAPW